MNTQTSTSDRGYAVEVDSVGKEYKIYDKPKDRLLDGLPYFRSKKQRFRIFRALGGITFKLEKGKTLGIVGKNGSGKSTLLQILCGTLNHTEGSYSVSGRIGALLELGSGFNPEFTGLENIFINASILGLSRQETNARLEKILAFADIGEFVNQPVKTYSSGMVVRLAFAVQAHSDPQVLIVDEALAVGDELFQKKCYQHLEGLKEQGVSIILVTHSCPQINQQCDEAMLLHKGRCVAQGKPQEVTFLYQQLMNEPDDAWDRAASEYLTSKKETKNMKYDNLQTSTDVGQASQAHAGITRGIQHQPEAWLDANLKSKSAITYPTHGATIKGAEILWQNDRTVNNLLFRNRFTVRVFYSFETSFTNVIFTCSLSSHTGGQITGQSLPSNEGERVDVTEGQEFWIDFCFEGRLWPGFYFVSAGISSPDCKHRFIHRAIDISVLKVFSDESPRIHGTCAMDDCRPVLVNQS